MGTPEISNDASCFRLNSLKEVGRGGGEEEGEIIIIKDQAELHPSIAPS